MTFQEYLTGLGAEPRIRGLALFMGNIVVRENQDGDLILQLSNIRTRDGHVIHKLDTAVVIRGDTAIPLKIEAGALDEAKARLG